MKRFIPILFAFLIPATMFAQARKIDENTLLKGFGLSDSQITQVLAIKKATHDTIRADFTHIRLIQAQIAEALLPSASGPDPQTINALIDKKSQLRTDVEKSFMSARIQLMKIMGYDNYSKYSRFVMVRMNHRFQRWQGRFMGPAGGSAPMMQVETATQS